MWLCILLTLIGASLLMPTSDGRASASDVRLAPFSAATHPGTVVFERAGDLWVKQLPDGEERRLTTNGDTSSPRWSTSGAWIAYLREPDGTGHLELWVIRASGLNAHRVATLDAAGGGHASWSPTDDTLAFVADGGLLVARPDADGSRELVPSGFGVQDPAWSPDGQRVAYATVQVVQPGAPPERDAALAWVDVRDGTRMHILDAGHPAEAGYLAAGWSSDGTHVLYWTQPLFSASVLADGVPLMAVPASGGTPEPLASTMLARPDFLAWAPDGGQPALVNGGGRTTWAEKAVEVIDASGGRRPVSTPDQAALWPAWAPGGDWIAYAAGPAAPGTADEATIDEAVAGRRIWLARPDGSDRHALTADPAYRDERPRWSADGAWIVFARLASQGDHGTAQLWLARSDGTALQPAVDQVSLGAGVTWPESYGYVDWGKLWDWRPSPGPAGRTSRGAPAVAWPSDGSSATTLPSSVSKVRVANPALTACAASQRSR